MIHLIRLINDDTLIGKIIFEDENIIIFKDPLILREIISRNEESGTAMYDYNPFSENSAVEIYKDKLLFKPVVVSSALERYYFNSVVYNKLHWKPSYNNSIMKASAYMEGFEEYETETPRDSLMANFLNNRPISNTAN